MDFLKSRTVWTIVILFVINGVEGVRGSIPANALPIIDAILSVLAIYFRVAPKAELGGQKKI